MAATGAQIAVNGQAAANMREALKTLGWSNAEFGRKIKPQSKNPAGVVTNWLGGKSTVPVSQRRRVAKILGITTKDLMPTDESAEAPASKTPRKKYKKTGAMLNGAATEVHEASAKVPFSFQMTPDGQAHIKLDLVTSLENGREIFDLLLRQHAQKTP